MKIPEATPFDPNAPQVEYQDVPDYYENSDVPHVLARIRAGERFFEEVVEEKFREVHSDLYHEHLQTLQRELQPYALDLALSLISLEDSLRKKAE